MKIGILAYHGDVIEHFETTKKALKNLNLKAEVIFVRTKEDIQNLDAIIIPGGESTVLFKLSIREGIFEKIKSIKNIFGTCAGAIMLAKKIHHKTADQKTLELMDIEVDRNAYGRQTESFEEDIDSKIGKIHAVFIRAPRIINIGENVNVLAKNGNEIIACEQGKPVYAVGSRGKQGKYYLALCFHPELTTTKFHEYFIKNLV